MHLARCKYIECKKKDDCLRYTEEKDIMPINFKVLIVEDECNWFYQKKETEEEKKIEKVVDSDN